MQLFFCEHGIRNNDGRRRFSLVLLIACQPDNIYRCVLICTDYFSEQWGISDNCSGYSLSDEQQTSILQPFVCFGISEDGKKEMVHGSHDDR